MAHKRELLTGIFFDRDSAEVAVDRLRDLGYRDNDISIVIDDARAGEFADPVESKAAEGLASGAIIGGGLGALIAAITTTGSIATIAATGGMATPLVVGPLAAALAGLGAGGAAGGIIGALIGSGMHEERAKLFEEGLRHGGIILAVPPRGSYADQEAMRVLSQIPRDSQESGMMSGREEIDYEDDIDEESVPDNEALLPYPNSSTRLEQTPKHF
ncbi:MAG TPA: hypothetical protein VGZ00_00935 [Candidatus Baltobacteraceae bacterium]|jgi:hypothetical protein|nr:hypothetical protein [Candidatus Baltobacteraceae bacterium]